MKGLVDRCRAARVEPLVVFGVVALALVLLVGDSFVLRVLTLVFLWSVAATAWNLAYGYTGLLSFGHSAFIGLGAYTLVFLVRGPGLSPFLAIPAAMVVAAMVAAIVGAPTFRLSGAYFGLATLVFPLILIALIDYFGLNEVTLPFPPDPRELYMEFPHPRWYALLALALLLATLVGMRRLERSRAGYVLRAIRENQAVAAALGIDTFRWKLLAFSGSAAIAGAMGVVWVKAALLIVASRDVFGLAIVAQTIAMCLVGGLGNLWGPVIGAALLVPTAELINLHLGARVPGIQLLAYGCTLVLVVLFAPDGLYWRLRARRPTVSPPAPAAVCPVEAPLVLPATVPATTAADRPILQVAGLGKSFGGLRALHDVSVAVPRGQVLGIIGPNGSGKTTFFNVVNGFHPPTAGRIVFAGRDVTRLGPHARCHLGIGRTFQTPQLLPRLSVRDNVTVAAFNRTADAREAQERADAVLAALGLAGKRLGPVSGLTVLEVKLVELARALATGPSLLLVDEPMAGLNLAEQTRIGDLLRRLAGEGVTVLVIEHSVRSLLRVADRLMVLDQGELIAVGSGAAVTRDPRVIEAYLGRKWVRDAGRSLSLG